MLHSKFNHYLPILFSGFSHFNQMPITFYPKSLSMVEAMDKNLTLILVPHHPLVKPTTTEVYLLFSRSVYELHSAS